MGSFFAPLLSFLGTVFSPVTFLFHYIFYQPVFNVLMLVYLGVHNFALAIVILTLLIRACMIPLTRKQLRSSRMMQELAPQITELKAQYKDDPQGMLAAQQALYKEHGVSLYGGCLPMLVQLPFLYALYYAFETVLLAQAHESITHHIARINHDIYPFLPQISHLPNPFFFWTSLATPDKLYILPILAGILTFIQLRMALPVRPKTRTARSGPDPSQTMATMQYIMPFFTVFIGLSFPAGLALYWCISTGFSAVQQYFISGWGSLFVGVPGMERYVPQPKVPTPTVTNVTRGGGSSRSTSATGGASTARAIAPPVPEQGQGFIQRVRARIAAAQEAAEARRQGLQSSALVEPKKTASVSDEQATSADPPKGEANGANGASGAQAAPREKRPRASKSGVTLVKANVPATDGASSNGSNNSHGSNGSNGSNGATANGSKPTNGAKKPLQAQATIKRDGVGMVGVNGASAKATTKPTAQGVSVGKPTGASGANGAGAKGSTKGDRPKSSQSQGQRGRTASGSGRRR